MNLQTTDIIIVLLLSFTVKDSDTDFKCYHIFNGFIVTGTKVKS